MVVVVVVDVVVDVDVDVDVAVLVEPPWQFVAVTAVLSCHQFWRISVCSFYP